MGQGTENWKKELTTSGNSMPPFRFNPLILSAFACPGKGKHLPRTGKYLQNILALMVSTLQPKIIHGWFIPSCTCANTNSSFSSSCTYWQWYTPTWPWVHHITLFEQVWPILEWRDSLQLFVLLIFLCTSSSFSGAWVI